MTVSAVQVLTLEDWEKVMFSTIRGSGEYASFLFFVVWILIGKYTLLTLFLAVLMEAFEVAFDKGEAAKALMDGTQSL